MDKAGDNMKIICYKNSIPIDFTVYGVFDLNNQRAFEDALNKEDLHLKAYWYNEEYGYLMISLFYKLGTDIEELEKQLYEALKPFEIKAGE
jgi:hypothetical protein